MPVGEGKFVLYSRIEPPLTAGDYRFTTTQDLEATRDGEALSPTALPVAPLETHVRVRSPQYQLPPDQVLSTYPPAGSEGSYGSRLPQVVIRRRTLPWERSVGAGHEGQPWLALVLVAEGEAELRMNQPVADCVTHGVELDSPADVELGNCLAIRKSVVERVFPTQEEVHLLAHAREVDIHDTELMMGDDDGFLAVVIANRLPLPARDKEGKEAPVKYLACLVNLCGQFDSLLERAPEPRVRTAVPFAVTEQQLVSLAAQDHLSMGSPRGTTDRLLVTGVAPKAVSSARTTIAATTLDPGVAAPYESKQGWGTSSASRGMSSIYAEMARPFADAYATGFVAGATVELDPRLTFPVLLHWSFTSAGSMTFRSLMEGLDSGLLGTLGTAGVPAGRPPFEVVETGHVGLAHRTRRGEPVRSWYRGPLGPHPTVDPPEGRLPLAHTADQIRVIVPDGREDISIAAAFEIGRLLALSRPSMVSALMRWRQLGYQAAQLQAAFEAEGLLLDEITKLDLALTQEIGGRIGAVLAETVAGRPDEVLGDPRPLVDPGRPLLEPEAVNSVLSVGFGINKRVFAGGADSVLGSLEDTPVRLPRTKGLPDSVKDLRAVLTPRLDERFSRTAVLALAPEIREGELELGRFDRLPIDLRKQVLDVSLGEVAGALLPDRLDILMKTRAARGAPATGGEEP